MNDDPIEDIDIKEVEDGFRNRNRQHKRKRKHSVKMEFQNNNATNS